MSKTIRLTKGYEAIVDDEDAEYVSQYNWHVHTTSKNVKYAARQVQRNNIRKNIFLHQVIIERMGLSPLKGLRIYHKDGDRLNNRRNNLKVKSCNFVSYKTIRSTGICYRAKRNKWEAEIIHNKRRIYLGYFDTLHEATAARRKAEKKYSKN